MKHENIGNKIFNVFNIMIMVFLAVIMVFPYVNVAAKAFNDGIDTMLGGISLFPRVPTLENFGALLGDKEIINSGFISVSRVILGTVFALVIQYSAAYAFTKKKLRGRGAMLIFLMIPMYFGGGIIPVYLLYSKIHFLNSFLVYIIPGAFSLYNMVIIRTFLYTIPESLQESARLDGANEFVIMVRIMIPLSLSILATVALWTAVNQWNDWVTTLMFITTSKLYTLQYILVQILQEADRVARLIQETIKSGKSVDYNNLPKTTPEALRAAQIILTTIPIVIVYPFLQKYFIKGVMIGAIKD